jgi:hypothetical protein
VSARPLRPFRTASDALLAVRPDNGSFTGREGLLGLLTDTLEDAGVALAGWDSEVASWLADLDVQTVVTVCGWVSRAAGWAAEDARRLGEIRTLLARFDWEHDDRQYALEAIERIADGGQA